MGCSILFYFFLLFLVDLYLLGLLGYAYGTLAVLAAILLPGLMGLGLAQSQGRNALQRIRLELSQGQLPALPMVEGLLAFIAGVLLLMPGLLSTVLGLGLLMPGLRRFVARRIVRHWNARFERTRATGCGAFTDVAPLGGDASDFQVRTHDTYIRVVSFGSPHFQQPSASPEKRGSFDGLKEVEGQELKPDSITPELPPERPALPLDNEDHLKDKD